MLNRLLGSKLRAKLLGWLMMHPQERYFVRQLTVLLGADSTNVSRELTKLAGMGILVFQQQGRQKYYGVNPNHPAFAELRGLVLKTAGLSNVVSSALNLLSSKIVFAFIFGSFARAEDTADSDVDLLIVGNITLKDVSAVLGQASRQLGREFNPVIYTPAEFRSKVKAKHHFITEILKDKKMFIIGSEHDVNKLIG